MLKKPGGFAQRKALSFCSGRRLLFKLTTNEIKFYLSWNRKNSTCESHAPVRLNTSNIHDKWSLVCLVTKYILCTPRHRLSRLLKDKMPCFQSFSAFIRGWKFDGQTYP